ncbi:MULTISPECIES: hypothetical protein [unclassified Microcoleus]
MWYIWMNAEEAETGFLGGLGDRGVFRVQFFWYIWMISKPLQDANCS